ncbi:MAG: hypothetical protein M1823_003985 [Watsoniomyces obsoletus]|nr:MAG: hypothetical protein M1823_003985 [Watsoniomyces obsoletus]
MASYDSKRQSILGALFSTFKGGSSAADHEESPDDRHTRTLLFPADAQDLSSSSSSSTLPIPTDVRVIIAQDATGANSKWVLYDSHVGSEIPRRRGLQGVFSSEPVGEMRSLLDCMFGTTPLSYRGDTTKMHVLPNDDEPRSATSPIPRDPVGSWGRRRSNLSHSFTPNDVAEPNESSKDIRALLTRTFSVNLPDLPESSGKPRQRKTPVYAVAMIVQISRDEPLESPGAVDDRIDLIMSRWDIATRVMKSLQAFMRPIIRSRLERTADALRCEGMPKTRRQMYVQLEGGALSSDETVKKGAERVGARLLSGLRIPKVATGQGRWDEWQDEARWIERWAGGREHNFFFDRLLTAFLGNHTLWVAGLGYGRRAPDDDIPRRTIIVGGDKPAARRLIFLLAAFLPGVSTWSPPRMEDKAASSQETSEKASSALPIPPGTGTRKSSATTTATITPATQRLGTIEGSPTSSMIRTMKRDNSTDHSTDSQSATRWGSWVSGVWSTRRGSSTDDSEPPDETGSRGGSKNRRSGGKLAQMVRQVDTSRQQDDSLEPPSRGRSSGMVSPEPIIYPDSPLKLSVDEKDGIVDVDFQMPSFLSSSFGSSAAARSPSASGFPSGSFEEGSCGHSSGLPTFVPVAEIEPPVNVAGWLRRFHPDFMLQAVQSYPELMDEVKSAMTTEPVAAPKGKKWKTVCTTIIADAGTYTVKRLRLLRRWTSSSSDTTQQTTQEEHKFIEEPVFDMDGTLIDAVERVTGSKPVVVRPAETVRPSVMALTAALGGRSHPVSRASSISRPAGSIKIAHPDDVGEASKAKTPVHEPEEDTCERIIRHALEEVVKDVLFETDQPESHALDENDNDEEEEQDRRGKMIAGTENSLRDGIRQCFVAS